MFLERLKKEFPAIKRNEPLKSHCTMRVGGPADYFYELRNIEELPPLATIAEENSIPYRVIGRGSNVLFTDKGFRGLIIKNLTNEIRIDGRVVATDSGVLLSQLIQSCIDNNLNGLEYLWSIPGTVGGAVWGNAGTKKAEIWPFIKKISVFNASDGIRELPAEEFRSGYRWSSLQETNDLILRIILQLKKGSQKTAETVKKEIAERRRAQQPAGFSAGCFFKNPSKDQSAALLIEQTGLKGMRAGDAEISSKHANFIMNAGQATTAQILKLAQIAQQKVKDKFGIELETEVKIIGDL